MRNREKDLSKWVSDNEYLLKHYAIRMSADWVCLPLKDFLDKITDVEYDATELELLMYLSAKTNRFDNEKIKSTLDYIEYYRKNLLLQTSKLRGNASVLDINAVTKFLKEKLNDNEVTLSPQQITLPDNLLQALQQAGFIENAAASPLKWLKSKSLLAYFVEVANDKLKLKDSGGRRQIKPFETLFNVTGLQSCINEYKNKIGRLPQGNTDIDKIFSKLRY